MDSGRLPSELFISIHALRKESDLEDAAFEAQWCGISIHALRKESDPEF